MQTPLVLALTALAWDVPAQSIAPPPGLLAWWPGDGTTDELVDARHGAFVGTPTFDAGGVDDAFLFTGANWVAVPDDAAWTLGSADFTIEAWVRFDSLSGRDPIVAHDEGGGERNKWILWYDANGHRAPGGPALRFHINSPSLPPIDTVIAPWSPVLGSWYHVALTRSGTTYTLYVDGAALAAETDARAVPDPAAELTIGRAESFRSHAAIDEVSLYGRALTAGEIQAIHAAGSAGKDKVTDSDADGLTDHDELLIHGTDPHDADTDDDGLLDGTEVDMAGGSGCPDPLVADSDGDSLSDGYEVLTSGTSPCLADTDGEAVTDDVDPLPTVPGVTTSFLEERIRLLAEYVAALPDTLVAAPNRNATKGRRNSLANRVRNAAKAVARGDESSAVDLLEGVRAKVDTGSGATSWLTASAEQIAVFDELTLLLALLAL